MRSSSILVALSAFVLAAPAEAGIWIGPPELTLAGQSEVTVVHATVPAASVQYQRCDGTVALYTIGTTLDLVDKPTLPAAPDNLCGARIFLSAPMVIQVQGLDDFSVPIPSIGFNMLPNQTGNKLELRVGAPYFIDDALNDQDPDEAIIHSVTFDSLVLVK